VDVSRFVEARGARVEAACAEPPHVGPLLGCYVLGALGRRDVKAVERHLRVCALCSEERARLAALPRLLDASDPRRRG
jgi:hypothetical protein